MPRDWRRRLSRPRIAHRIVNFEDGKVRSGATPNDIELSIDHSARAGDPRRGHGAQRLPGIQLWIVSVQLCAGFAIVIPAASQVEKPIDNTAGRRIVRMRQGRRAFPGAGRRTTIVKMAMEPSGAVEGCGYVDLAINNAGSAIYAPRRHRRYYVARMLQDYSDYER